MAGNASRTLNLPPPASKFPFGTRRAFCVLPHILLARCLLTTAMSSDFSICNPNNPEQLEQAFGKLGLFLNRPESCIICIGCKYALHPSAEAVSKHLWSVHKTPSAARKGLNRVVESLRFPNPSTLPVRHDGSILHPHLAALNGAVCKIWSFRTTSVELMGRHMSKKHQRKNDRKTWISDEVDPGARLQSWTTPGHRVYWVVAPDDLTSDSQAALPADCSPRRTERAAALHDEERRRLRTLEKARTREPH
jgi:hypothetical protein